MRYTSIASIVFKNSTLTSHCSFLNLIKAGSDVFLTLSSAVPGAAAVTQLFQA